MRTVQQWFVAVALASIGVMVVLIILSAQFSLADPASQNPSPGGFTDQQIVPVATPIPSLLPQQTLQPAATIAPQEIEHTVNSGETLGSIAAAYGCASWEVVADYNQLIDPNRLEVGQVLKIPNTC